MTLDRDGKIRMDSSSPPYAMKGPCVDSLNNGA